MSSRAQAVLAAAAELTEVERSDLIRALLLETDGAEGGEPGGMADAWREEVRRRSLELRSGVVRPLPLAEVLAEGERILDGTD